MSKRKRSRKSGKRRRKLGGFSMKGINPMRTLSNVGGGFAGAYVGDLIDAQSFAQSNKYITPGAIVAGGALIEIMVPASRDVIAGMNGVAGAMLQRELMPPKVEGIPYDFNRSIVNPNNV